MHLTPPTSSERPIIQSLNHSSLQLAFGYSTAQLPTLGTGSTWGLSLTLNSSLPMLSRALVIWCGLQITLKMTSSHHKMEEMGALLPQTDLVLPPLSPLPPTNFVHKSEQSQSLLITKPDSFPIPFMAAPTVQASHHMTEKTGTCSSSQKDNETKGNNFFKPKETSDQTGPEGFPEGSAVRPGIDLGVKFGGCGSYPDLPWVSTTRPGPNGKTISDAPNLENSSGLASFPNGNPAASAQS
ncbi:hypothetical protein AAC387_Pa03g4574 [Persea americana]